eukprot:m.44712 g.44712  ORF g.44712 m.44712 type:complete len:60 (-) comp47058_c0_seq4:47-226(-)
MFRANIYLLDVAFTSALLEFSRICLHFLLVTVYCQYHSSVIFFHLFPDDDKENSWMSRS